MHRLLFILASAKGAPKDMEEIRFISRMKTHHIDRALQGLVKRNFASTSPRGLYRITQPGLDEMLRLTAKTKTTRKEAVHA